MTVTKLQNDLELCFKSKKQEALRNGRWSGERYHLSELQVIFLRFEVAQAAAGSKGHFSEINFAVNIVKIDADERKVFA